MVNVVTAREPASGSNGLGRGASEAAASERGLVAAALIALVALLLRHLLGTGFTCDDDMFTATARLRWGGVWQAAWAMASGHGRFYHLIVYPIAQTPYLFDGTGLATAARILSTASVFGAQFLAARALVGSTRFASLVVVVAGGLLTTSHMFNPVHALPLWFNLGMTVQLLSLWAFARGLERGGAARVWGGVLYFCALLFYETFFSYVVLFPVIAFLRGGGPARVRAALRASAPQFLAAGLWLACWVSFRLKHPPDYRGGDLALGPIGEMVGTVVTFSLSGLHLAAPWREPFAWHPSAALAALLAAGLCALLLWRLRGAVPTSRLLAVAVLGGLFALAPNLIFGLTPRYRQWVKGDPYYLGSFYAAFALTFVLGALALVAVQAARKPALARLLVGATSALLGLATYANHAESGAYFLKYRAIHRLWTAVDRALDHGLAGQLGSASVVVAPYLVDPGGWSLSPGAYDYWSFHLTQRLGRPMLVVGSPTDQSAVPAPHRASLAPQLATAATLPVLTMGERGDGRARFVALGELDGPAWRESNGKQLVTRKASVWLEGVPGRLLDGATEVPAAAGPAGGADRLLESARGIDLVGVSIRE
jgi:hypothetical protein